MIGIVNCRDCQKEEEDEDDINSRMSLARKDSNNKTAEWQNNTMNFFSNHFTANVDYGEQSLK